MGKNNIYRRKDGRYEGRIYHSIGGKRTYQSFYGKTAAQVERRLNEVMESGASAEITVGELLDKWMGYISGRVKRSTASNYRMKLSKHLLPYFAKLSCSGSLVSEAYGFVDKKRAEGLSFRYILDMITILRSAFKYASHTLGIYAPLAGFRMKRPARSDTKLLSERDQKRLKERFTNVPTLTDLGIALSLFSGLRIGEVCAMKWSDMDNNIPAVISEDVYSYKTGLLKSETAPCVVIAHSQSPDDFRRMVIPLLHADNKTVLLARWGNKSKVGRLVDKYNKLVHKQDKEVGKLQQMQEEKRDIDTGKLARSFIRNFRLNRLDKKIDELKGAENFFHDGLMDGFILVMEKAREKA